MSMKQRGLKKRESGQRKAVSTFRITQGEKHPFAQLLRALHQAELEAMQLQARQKTEAAKRAARAEATKAANAARKRRAREDAGRVKIYLRLRKSHELAKTIATLLFSEAELAKKNKGGYRARAFDSLRETLSSPNPELSGILKKELYYLKQRLEEGKVGGLIYYGVPNAERFAQAMLEIGKREKLW